MDEGVVQVLGVPAVLLELLWMRSDGWIIFEPPPPPPCIPLSSLEPQLLQKKDY